MVVSIDSHSENPCFSVEFDDTYHVKLGVEELGHLSNSRSCQVDAQ